MRLFKVFRYSLIRNYFYGIHSFYTVNYSTVKYKYVQYPAENIIQLE